MRVWGLTGNIGSGKSTVARLLAARGVPVVDADQVAREMVAPDGTLDRRALAARVFADARERAELNRIVHPRIAEEVSSRLGALAGEGYPVAVYEAALIIENRMHDGLDGLVVVTAPEAAQLARLRERDGMSEEEARARLAAQLPAADKLRHATFVIDNQGSEAELEAQVDRLLAAMGGVRLP
jgi:dephospho-CoA kinase